VEFPENLCSLVFSGGDNHKLAVKHLESIGRCAQLKYLALSQVKVHTKGLAPLASLQSLEYLWLDFFRLRNWSLQDYQLLYENLPNLKCECIKLAATDREFQKLHKIK